MNASVEVFDANAIAGFQVPRVGTESDRGVNDRCVGAWVEGVPLANCYFEGHVARIWYFRAGRYAVFGPIVTYYVILVYSTCHRAKVGNVLS